jgi:hypothetical protein
VENGGTLEEGITSLAGSCQAHRDLTLDAMVPSMITDMLARAAARDDIVLMGVEV